MPATRRAVLPHRNVADCGVEIIVHVHAGTGLNILVPMKGNLTAKAYKDRLYSYVLLTLLAY